MGLVTLGDWSYGSIKVIGQNCGHVHVGKFTSIAEGVQVIAVGHNPSNVSTFPFAHRKFSPFFPSAASASHLVKYGPTSIGNDVWIGQNATIIGGTTIGDGAIVAAGAMVTAPVLPYCVVAGNPARPIRYRFDAETCVELMKIRWWDWPEQKIIENAGLLCSEDIEAFIAKHKEG